MGGVVEEEGEGEGEELRDGTRRGGGGGAPKQPKSDQIPCVRKGLERVGGMREA